MQDGCSPLTSPLSRGAIDSSFTSTCPIFPLERTNFAVLPELLCCNECMEERMREVAAAAAASNC